MVPLPAQRHPSSFLAEIESQTSLPKNVFFCDTAYFLFHDIKVF